MGVTLAAVAVLVAMSSWDDLLAALAAASVIVAGVLLAWHGRSWPALARRYDRDGAPPRLICGESWTAGATRPLIPA